MTQAVSVSDLTIKFDEATVLDHLSIDFVSGEIVGLIGPSGAGKSTFINALLGLIKRDNGSVKIFDTVIPNRKIMSKIGYMAQSDALFGELTGKQNLEFFGSLQGISKKALSENLVKAAATVNLTEDLTKKLKNYSGGMKRRLSLAIALQTDAPLILLDEPTVGIDPELRAEIWSELRQLKGAGKTILVTTHVMDEAERCDKVLLLRQGHFVAQGSPAEIKAKYRTNTIEEAFIKAGARHDKRSVRIVHNLPHNSANLLEKAVSADSALLDQQDQPQVSGSLAQGISQLPNSLTTESDAECMEVASAASTQSDQSDQPQDSGSLAQDMPQLPNSLTTESDAERIEVASADSAQSDQSDQPQGSDSLAQDMSQLPISSVAEFNAGHPSVSVPDEAKDTSDSSKKSDSEVAK